MMILIVIDIFYPKDLLLPHNCFGGVKGGVMSANTPHQKSPLIQI